MFGVVMSAVVYAGVGGYLVTRPSDYHGGVIMPLLINGDTTNSIVFYPASLRLSTAKNKR
jgi:hypothetical protein